MCVCVGVRENNKDLSKTAEHKLVTIKCCHIQIFVFSLSDIVCTVLGKCIECVVFMLYLLLKANKWTEIKLKVSKTAKHLISYCGVMEHKINIRIRRLMTWYLTEMVALMNIS